MVGRVVHYPIQWIDRRASLPKKRKPFKMVGFAHVDRWHILTYSTMYICRQGYGVIDLQCAGTYILDSLMTCPLVGTLKFGHGRFDLDLGG